MCRWLAYSGAPVNLEELLFKPKNSLVIQSKHSKMGATTTNGDGFGVGWYGVGETPGIFRSTEPAWNDRNLRELSALASSRRVFAHIRASTGSAVQQTNCHPVPARELAVDAQRCARLVRDDEARPGPGGRSRPVPGDRGVDRLGDAVLPGTHLRAGGGPADRGRPGRRPGGGDRAPARDRRPGPDDGGDHGRRDDVGVPLLQLPGSRGRCSTAPTCRRCVTSTPTTPCCTTCPTTHGWWCPSRSVTSRARGARSRSRRTSRCTVPGRTCGRSSRWRRSVVD